MEGHDGKAPWSSTALRELGRLVCAAKGHSLVMCFEPDRMRLECVSCGYRSQGWEVQPRTRPVSSHASHRHETSVIEAGLLSQHG
jgi:hypothetical protein